MEMCYTLYGYRGTNIFSVGLINWGGEHTIDFSRVDILGWNIKLRFSNIVLWD